MSLSTKLLLLLTTFGMASFANTISFTGPSDTIIGDPYYYDIFGVQLTQPTGSNSDWVATIETNYPETIPGSPDVVPPYVYNGTPYGMGDLLFTWNGNDYGIVLTPHNGYAAGDLYEASGFLTSGQVMGAAASPRPSVPVLLAPGGSLAGVGFLSGAETGNGVTTGLYTVTDDFSAPAGFLFDRRIRYPGIVLCLRQRLHHWLWQFPRRAGAGTGNVFAFGSRSRYRWPPSDALRLLQPCPAPAAILRCGSGRGVCSNSPQL